jgi:Methyltransferase small domain
VLRLNDTSAVLRIRRFFDDIAYAYMSYRLIPGNDTDIFPDFGYLQNILKGLNPIYRFVFSVFRQGHATDEDIMREVFPGDLIEAMATTGLLVCNARGQWQTPGLAVVPIEGLYLVVSVPPHYPTALTRKQPIYLGTESIWLTRALPSRLTGRRVLDICAGSGIQGLICAARGARSAVGLEKAPEAAAIARFNVLLNGYSGIVEIRESDLFSALGAEERFDFVVSNPPFMPVMEDVDYPICGTGGADGTKILRGIFANVTDYLDEVAEGYLFCNVLGDMYSINFNREILNPLATKHELYFRSYVNDKFPLSEYMKVTLDGNLSTTCPEVSPEERKRKIAAWQVELQRLGVPADYVYSQIIHFRKGVGEAKLIQLPGYNPYMTDPLVVNSSLAKASA